jgi:hypothetical protein
MICRILINNVMAAKSESEAVLGRSEWFLQGFMRKSRMSPSGCRSITRQESGVLCGSINVCKHQHSIESMFRQEQQGQDFGMRSMIGKGSLIDFSTGRHYY